MDETRIVLVRHGESLPQEQGVVGGHAGDKGLSGRGREQVAALRDRLSASGELAGTAALYSSVMARAVETAAILAPVLGLEAVADDDFCESHPGDADGMTVEELDRRWPRPERWTADLRRSPGAETFAEMRTRVARGLDGLVERHAGELVVVACHGGVVIHSMIRWLELEPFARDRPWLEPTNSGLTEWRFTPGRRVPALLARYDDSAHLEGSGLLD